jgi:hypothetical protein
MKNVLPAIGVLLLCTYTSMAQQDVASLSKKETTKEKRELRKKEVSYQSKQQFERDFPDANHASWRVSPNFEEAAFMNNGTPTTAYYDNDSQLVGTTVIKSFSDLPAKAQEHIRSHYQGYKPGDVILFDDNEVNETDMVLYSTAFEDEDNYFVPLKNAKETIILKVNMAGEVSFFKKV